MAATRKQPTMRARWLGQGLRRLREEAGLTMAEAGRHLQRDGSTVSRFETGVYPARMPDVLALLDLYGVRDRTRREFFTNLSRDVVEPGWWDRYGGDAAPELIDLAWLEARAWQIRSYHQSVLPAAFQTADYAESVLRTAEWNAEERRIQRWRDLRLDRRRMMDRDTPPRHSAILDEAVVRRVIGGPGIMRDQLDHLVRLAGRPHLDLRVIPFETGAHASPDSSFSVCRLAEPFPAVGYVGTIVGTVYTDAATAERFDAVFERLLAVALDPERSLLLIEEVAAALDRLTAGTARRSG
jgi:transcriptional regulator with XRE-family HTH domain